MGSGMIPSLAAMMDDQQSIGLFVVGVVALAVVAAALIPVLIKQLTLKQAVPILAMTGPVLAVGGSLIGSGAMTLSGRDVGYVSLVALLTGLAAILVGWRIARPLAGDLGEVSQTVQRLADGDRNARTGIERTDEVGDLAAAVDELGRTLMRAEAERSAAEAERRSVVSALSHDLRTPLASLLVSVEALEDGVADGPQHLRSMRRNVLALERLVEDLFLLARADSGRLALHSEPLDIAELVDEALEAIGPAAADQGVSLGMTGAVAGLVVNGDDTALGRVLRNLLDNAVRYTESGGNVDVELRGNPDGGTAAEVTVTVSDTGAGFDPEFIPHAFDRFSQADSARSSHGGAGLGLAIAHRMVEAHGGQMKIYPGPGGRVSFTIPTSGAARKSAPTSV